MTEFRKHDRVRVVDASPHKSSFFLPLSPGAVEQVESYSAGVLRLTGWGGWWKDSRFELVERAVAEDKDGTPLYVGDVVTWTTAGGLDRAVGCIVQEEQADPVAVRVTWNGATYTPPRREVTLTRHRWEPEAAPESLEFSAEDGFETSAGVYSTPAGAQNLPTQADMALNAAVKRLGETLEEWRKSEVERVTAAMGVLDSAFQKAVKSREVTAPALPTTPGSIVGPADRADRSEAVLMGLKWYFVSGLPFTETHPGEWDGFRVIRDAGGANREGEK